MNKEDMQLAREIVEEKSMPVTESGCWIWEGTSDYCRVSFDKKRMYAHRLAYTAFKGIIPIEEKIIHKCHIPCCVNPNHLTLVHEDVKSK